MFIDRSGTNDILTKISFSTVVGISDTPVVLSCPFKYKLFRSLLPFSPFLFRKKKEKEKLFFLSIDREF